VDAMLAYAARHKLTIVKSYIDSGRSGLSIEGRDALMQLIEDIINGNAHFSTVLVYDISRWGRFQDIDESAHYEYVCKQAGVDIRYCAEHFDNNGSLAANIMKGMKRAMAAEFSRELSIKVLQGQKRLAALGYYHGGVPPYGLRRQLIDAHGKPRAVLVRGEAKHLQTDRVILVHGPAKEIEVVRRIFRLFAVEHMPRQHIAELLNREGVPNSWGNHWSHNNVLRILKNEIYIGRKVYNRSSQKLRTNRTPNPPDQWVTKDDVVSAIIDPDQFMAAQRLLRNPWTYTDGELLNYLTCVLCAHGRLTSEIIRQMRGPSLTTYFERFGRLSHTLRLIGYKGGGVSGYTGDPSFPPTRRGMIEQRMPRLPWKHVVFRYRLPVAGG
jgi:DNA invertase Pin-like site-specific DNA recombinase